MIKIAITGSLASGKSSAAKLIKKKKYKVFSADKSVTEIYKKKKIRKLIKKRFNFENTKEIKNKVKISIINKKINMKKLEKIIHPEVRRERNAFIKKNKNHKILFFEIPLLFESKLEKSFDKIIFIHAMKKMRYKRYLLRGGNKKIFTILDRRQVKPLVKIKRSDYVIANNKSLKYLRKSVFRVLRDL